MRTLLFASIAESTDDIYQGIHVWLSEQTGRGDLSFYATLALVACVTMLLAGIAYLFARFVVAGVLRAIARRTRTQWDDFLVDHRMFARLSLLAPACVFYKAAEFFPGIGWDLVERLSLGGMVIAIVLVLDSGLNVLVDIYSSLRSSRSNPIKAFVQGVKIILFLMGTIFFVSAVFNQSPWKLVASIGAVTAVLLLVFKDSILGLVASIQIVANDLVRTGDWVEMPKYGADGNVIDITLTTIKIQNWDRTITTVPTYALISDSFKNWRGMEESSGRRIKRSLCIDMNTVKFLDPTMLDRFERFDCLGDFLRQRRLEVKNYNETHEIDTSEPVNGRRLTNLGMFRAYLEAYLKRHPKIHPEMTFLVRHLTPTPNGLPIEIYVFSTDKEWANYEEIQADIFDHILAVISEFDLRVFQHPTGHDMKSLVAKLAEAA